MPSERRGDRILTSRQAMTPARYEEGTLATNHNAATRGRGYHNKHNTHANHENKNHEKYIKQVKPNDS